VLTCVGPCVVAGRDVPHGPASAAAAAGFQRVVYLAGGLGALSQQHGHVRSVCPSSKLSCIGVAQGLRSAMICRLLLGR
jgi:hypothetical protein